MMSESKKSDLAVCRACLSVDVKLHDIKESLLMRAAFETATGLSVEQHDKLPPYLCVYCCITVRRSVSFRRQCHMSQESMKLLADSGELTLQSIKLIDSKPLRHFGFPVSELKVYACQYTPSELHEKLSNSQVVAKVDRFWADNSAEIQNNDQIQSFSAVYIKSEIEDDEYSDTLPEERHKSDEASGIDKELILKEDKDVTIGSLSIEFEDQKPIASNINTMLNISSIENEDEPTDKQSIDTVTKRKIQGENKAHTSEDTCGKLFSVLSTGEKPFKCETCGKLFATKRNLFVHNRRHTWEKPFECDTCGLKFRYMDSLSIHIKVHRDEWPIKCDTCHERFLYNIDLTDHKRIHTGERPFQCETCGNLFADDRIFSQHMNQHTEEKSFKCNTGCLKRKFTFDLPTV